MEYYFMNIHVGYKERNRKKDRNSWLKADLI